MSVLLFNAMLDEEADQLVGAGPCERTDERAAYRAGHYERGIERYKRRETLVEEAIIEMYLAGVSARRFGPIRPAKPPRSRKWGSRVARGARRHCGG